VLGHFPRFCFACGQLTQLANPARGIEKKAIASIPVGEGHMELTHNFSSSLPPCLQMLTSA